MFTPDPPVGAGLVKVTVQVAEPGAVIDVGLHASALNAVTTAGADAICSDVDLVRPLKDAVRVAVPAVAVEPTLAVKLASVAPPGTATDVGTTTPASELIKLTADPPDGAGPLKLTVQVAALGAVTDVGLQANPDKLTEE